MNGNNFDFEDLEKLFTGVDAHPFKLLNYSPQKEIDIEEKVDFVEYTESSLSSGTDGEFALWQWQKLDGTDWNDVAGKVDPFLVFSQIRMADAGLYRCKVANTKISDLILYTNPIQIYVLFNQYYDLVPDDQELQALAALYSQLSGETWINNANWLSGTKMNDVSGWYGIDVQLGDVTGISIPSNNLKGKLPQDIGLLRALETLNLSDNQLYGNIPVQIARLSNLKELHLNDNKLEGYMDLEFSVMPKIREMDLRNNELVSIPDFSFNPRQDKSQISLRAEKNRLEFLYIENNLNPDGSDIIGTYTYMPQKTFGDPKIIGFVEGNPFELTLSMLGRENHYQWQVSFDGGATWSNRGFDNAELSYPIATNSQVGDYRVIITNGRANKPGDKITSAWITVRVAEQPVIINRPLN